MAINTASPVNACRRAPPPRIAAVRATDHQPEVMQEMSDEMIPYLEQGENLPLAHYEAEWHAADEAFEKEYNSYPDEVDQPAVAIKDAQADAEHDADIVLDEPQESSRGKNKDHDFGMEM